MQTKTPHPSRLARQQAGACAQSPQQAEGPAAVIDRRQEAIAQRKRIEMMGNSARLGAGSSVLQMAPMNKAITGITHLVRMKQGSIYEGDEGREVAQGDIVRIETDEAYKSRRGPNQEVYRDADRTGDPLYKWIRVLEVNRFKVAADTFVRDDTIRDIEEEDKPEVGPWLTFGLSGRSLEQILSAIEFGYRRFDCADSYGNTALLAEAMSQRQLQRRDVEITYKFDVQARETKQALQQRLRPVLEMFAGQIDALLIHNVSADRADIMNAWTLLNGLKEDGAVRKTGVANVGAVHTHLVEDLKNAGGIDVIENSLSSVLADQDVKNLIRNSGAELHYYDVINTAREMEINSEDGIKALIYTIHADMDGNQSHMILSSSARERQQENLARYGNGEARAEVDNFDPLGTIHSWRQNANICQTNQPDFNLPGPVASFLRNIGNGAALRQTIAQACGTEVKPPDVKRWLVENNLLTNDDLQNILVPRRKKLKNRYVGMTLGDVMGGLLQTENCAHKWSIQLLALMAASVDDWDAYVSDFSEEITG